MDNVPELVTPPSSTEAPRPLPPELWPNIDHLVFEDGEPVDRIFTERQQRLLVTPLYASWEGPPGDHRFAAMSNVGLFIGPDIPHQVPDAMLSAGIEVHRDPHPREHHSYLLWVYGKPPDVVIELVSDRVGGELTSKLQNYQRFSIPYYVVYDPEHYLSTQELQVFRLEGNRYVPQEDAWFVTLGIGLRCWHGVYEGVEAEWLRWCRQDGTLIPAGTEISDQARETVEQAKIRIKKERKKSKEARQLVDEEKRRADAEKRRAQDADKRAKEERLRADVEKQRADVEKQRADEEKRKAYEANKRAKEAQQRADEEKQQVAKLRDRLRALGLDPDADVP